MAVGVLLVYVALRATLMPAWDRIAGTSSSEKNLTQFFEGPIIFEPNRGQADVAAKYVARGPGYFLYLTEGGTVTTTAMSFSRKKVESAFEVKLLNTSRAMRLVGLRSLPSKSSYYTGTDRSKWLTGISNFAEVQFQDAYPGIHVICHGMHGSLGYDFRIEPGARPELIAIEFAANGPLQVMSDGGVAIGTNERGLTLGRPTAYQDVNGIRHVVPVRYTVHKRKVGFAAGDYDRSKVLIIDPVLNYSEYLRNAAGRPGAGDKETEFRSALGSSLVSLETVVRGTSN